MWRQHKRSLSDTSMHDQQWELNRGPLDFESVMLSTLRCAYGCVDHQTVSWFIAFSCFMASISHWMRYLSCPY